jgi:hypothetical protein
VRSDVFDTPKSDAVIGRDMDHDAFSLRLAKEHAIFEMLVAKSQRFLRWVESRRVGLRVGPFCVPAIVTGPV